MWPVPGFQILGLPKEKLAVPPIPGLSSAFSPPLSAPFCATLHDAWTRLRQMWVEIIVPSLPFSPGDPVIRISALHKKIPKIPARYSAWNWVDVVLECTMGLFWGGKRILHWLLRGEGTGLLKGFLFHLPCLLSLTPYSTLLWKTPSLRLCMRTCGRRFRRAIFIKSSVFQSKSSHVKNCFAW